jgi:GNAT superfamily N-acetyltransferase
MSSQIRITNIAPQYSKALEDLQRATYPTLRDHERMKEAHFLNHCVLFPEGGFVALDGDRVVGLGSGFLINIDFYATRHSFNDVIAQGYYTNHNPEGEWYYGADISVHPDYRGKGIGGMLYKARKNLVTRLNKRGIVAGGLLPGFARYKSQMSVQRYVEKVISRELHDPTLSFQLDNGFVFKTLLKNYIHDKAADNWASLIVWENPEYEEEYEKIGR